MSLKQEEKHLPVLIAICFIGNFLLGGLGQLFPRDSFGQHFSWQWSHILFMAGGSLYAAKLHTDKWHISSAGFILLTVGSGVIFTAQDTNSAEAQALLATSVIAYLPGMVFLCYYTGFPLWLRLLGLITMIPFLITMIKIDMKTWDFQNDIFIAIAGFVLLQITGLGWSYYALRPYKKTTVQAG